MKRLVGVRGVKPRLEQSGGEALGSHWITRYAEFLVCRLVPHVLSARGELDCVVGVHAVRRYHIFAEILVLVVTPDQDEVGFEVVDPRAQLAEPREHRLAMAARGTRAPVVVPLLAHRGRPVLHPALVFGQRRVAQHLLEDCRHRLVATGQRRVVSETDSENFAHVPNPPWRRISGPPAPASPDASPSSLYQKRAHMGCPRRGAFGASAAALSASSATLHPGPGLCRG